MKPVVVLAAGAVIASALLAVPSLVGAGSAIPADAVGLAGSSFSSAAAKTFKNCTALNKTYAHGVGKPGAHDKVRGSTKPVTNFKVSASLYSANRKSDRDGDGVACEKR